MSERGAFVSEPSINDGDGVDENDSGDEEQSFFIPGGGAGGLSAEEVGVVHDVDGLRAAVAEFLGSFLLVFITLGVLYGGANVSFDQLSVERLIATAVGYGFVYASTLYAFSFPSVDRRVYPNTRHLNPAVTVALFVGGKTKAGQTLAFLVAQVAGAGVAAFFIFFTTPFQTKTVLTAYPLLEGVSGANSWWMECFVSFMTLLTILLTSFAHLSSRGGSRQPYVADAVWEGSPQTHHEINCIIAGSVTLVCNFVAGAVSGGFMNPLFALSIGILSGDYQLAAFVGPFAGAGMALVVGHIFGHEIEVLRKLFRRGYA